MKNEPEQDNVCRGSLGCSAFQFQLKTQFILQKVRNQRQIYAVNNRANEKQSQWRKEKTSFSNYFYPPLLLFSKQFLHLWKEAKGDWCRRSPGSQSKGGAISAASYWISTGQASSRRRYNLQQHGRITIDTLTDQNRGSALLQHNSLRIPAEPPGFQETKTYRNQFHNLLNTWMELVGISSNFGVQTPAEQPGRPSEQNKRSFFYRTSPAWRKHPHDAELPAFNWRYEPPTQTISSNHQVLLCINKA